MADRTAAEVDAARMLGELVGTTRALLTSSKRHDDANVALSTRMDRQDVAIAATHTVALATQQSTVKLEETVGALAQTVEKMQAPIQDFVTMRSRAIWALGMLATLGTGTWLAIGPTIQETIGHWWKGSGKT